MLHTWFQAYPEWAVLISLLVSTVVAILGLVPSYFVTAANIGFFGPWLGGFLSWFGEAFGAAVAFVLYRKGWTSVQTRLTLPQKIKALATLNGWNAMRMVFLLRLMPLMPSGLVTLAAATSQISFVGFVMSSSLGKIPALVLEILAVLALFQLPLSVQIVVAIAIGALVWCWVKQKA